MNNHHLRLVNDTREIIGVHQAGLRVTCDCGWSVFFGDERAAVQFANSELCPESWQVPRVAGALMTDPVSLIERAALYVAEVLDEVGPGGGYVELETEQARSLLVRVYLAGAGEVIAQVAAGKIRPRGAK